MTSTPHPPNPPGREAPPVRAAQPARATIPSAGPDPASSKPRRPRAAQPRRFRASPPSRLLATLLLLASLALPGAAAAQEDRDGITVAGTGVVYGEPDQAVVELGVDVVDQDVRAALAAANQQMTGVLGALRAAGVDERDIRTTAFDLWREERFPNPADQSRRETIFRARNLVSVTVRDTTVLGDLLVDAVEAGANVIGGIRFRMDDPAALEEEARRLAVQDARARAEQLAAAAGAELGGVVMITEMKGGNGGPIIPFREAAFAMDSAPVETGQLAVRVDVTVRFELGR